jgi:hypothetical protein
MQHTGRLARFAVGLILPVMFALVALPLRAQSLYGSIAGTVTDASGGVVPGATVTATNIGTNEKHTVKTGAAGEYRFVDLIPAVYKVEVQAPSFKRFVQDVVTVQVDTTIREDAALQIGAATETVEVTTEAPMLQTDSGSVGSEVEGKVVQEMPLDGRNSMNLLALVPGVVPESSTAGAAAGNANIHTYVNGWGNYSIGGGIANESANYIDGAPNNVLGGNPPALVPTQDMVQEFKVESNAVSAEYGHFGGGVVNMTTKSGTNAFHGSLYEYVRNTVLNTNDFVSDHNGLPKSPWHQNQYGAIVGGPIKRDRAFFEFSWEDYSLHKAQGNAMVVPTQAMRGDVSGSGGAILQAPTGPPAAAHQVADNSGKCTGIVNNYQGVTGQVFIPSSCFDPAANILKTFYAYPNQSPNAQGQNFVDQPLTGDDNYQYNGRVDYNLGKQRIFGRYTRWHLQDIGQDDFRGRPGNALHADFGSTGNETNNIVLGDTITLNSSTIADVRVSYMRDHFWNYGSNQGTFNVSALGGGYTSLATQVSYKEIPTFAIPGPDNISGPWDIPVGANQIDTYDAFSLNESLTKIAGKHTFKFGGESMLRDHSGIGNDPQYAGESTFLNAWSGTWTFGPSGPTQTGNGDEWASFMLGAFSGDTIHTVQNSFSIDWSHGAYFTDTWRATPKLTLNLGLRWEFPGGIYEKKDRATVILPNTIDPTDGSSAVNSQYPYLKTLLPGTLALTNSALYPSRDMSPSKWNLFGPRVSFGYGLSNSLVLRGGYGLSYIPPDMPTGLMAFDSPVNAANTSCSNPPFSISSTLANPFACQGGTIIQPLGRKDPYPMHVFLNAPVSSPVPTKNFPYMQQWNLALQKQWGSETVTVSYAGSKGTKLPNSGVFNGVSGSYTSINQLPYRYFGLGYNALSATAPCAALGGEVVAVAQCDLPFPQFSQGLFDTGKNDGGQDYEAIYLVYSKRFRSGGVINANYTYSHTVGDTDQPGFASGGGMQDFNNPKADKAVAAFDIPNRIIINYVLDLPFGKGQKWANSGGVANVIVGGWQVNGITTLQSGNPYSFSYNSSNTNLFYQSNNSTSPWGAGTPRPDILPGCNLKTSGSWFQKYNTANATGTVGNFFNAACLVPPGTQSWNAAQDDQQKMLFGNAPRNDDAVRSQFLDNFDFSAGKSTAIREGINLLFRAEFFNLFNHPVFGGGGAELGSGGYDQATPGSQRLVQLSLRLNF